MAKVIEAKDSRRIWKKGGKEMLEKFHLFLIKLANKDDIFEIAEILKIPFIFRKYEEELFCTDGTFLYWYRQW